MSDAAVDTAIANLTAALDTHYQGDDNTAKALAASEAHVTDLQDVNGKLVQKVSDLTTANVILEQTVNKLRVEIAGLKDKLNPRRTLYGANIGGYATSNSEPQAQAVARIIEGFGDLQIVRHWANMAPWPKPASFGDRPTFTNLGQDVQGVNAGRHDAHIDNLVANAPGPTFLSFAHEPEDEVFESHAFTLAEWQQAQMRIAARVRAIGRADVQFGPLLMGSTWQTKRFPASATGNVVFSEWLDFDLSNMDFLAGDFYQWGKNDADADTATDLMGQFFDACDAYGKPTVIGELGARRINPPYTPGISDQARATFLTQCLDLFAEKRPLAVMYFESDRGSVSKVPWLLLNNATGTGVKSPLAAAVWRSACLGKAG